MDVITSMYLDDQARGCYLQYITDDVVINNCRDNFFRETQNGYHF